MTSYMPPAKSDVHITPDRVYDIIKEKWGYDRQYLFDPCPVDAPFDGLDIAWQRVNFVNPPYSRLTAFVYKAMMEATDGYESIMLLPSKTDQEWFHEIIKEGYEIEWIKGRLRFKGEKWGATQPHFLCLIK